MRTTLELPVDLIDEARAVVGFKSKTDTVVFALREVVRRSKMDDLKALISRIDYTFDPTHIRRRERRRRRPASRSGRMS